MEKNSFVLQLQQDLKWYPSTDYRKWRNHKVLTAAEFNKLVSYSQDGCNSSLELVTIYSTRLVYSIVNRYRDNKPVEDHYMQSGFMGVLQAAERWIEAKGNFTTYAYKYIDRNVRHVINEEKDFIRVKSSDRYTLTSQIQYLFSTYKSECEFNLMPHNMETFTRWLNANGYTRNIKKGKLTSREVYEMLLITSVGSLDLEIQSEKEDESNTSIIQTIEDPSIDSLGEIINEETHEMLKLFCRELLHILSEKQKKVVALHYYNNLTFRQISKVLKQTDNQYSVSVCKELHTDAIAKIRQYVEEAGYTYEDFATVE